MTRGSEKCFKLSCPDCLAQGNKKSFKTWALLKNHMQWGYELPGHTKRSIKEIMQIIFRPEVLIIDGRGKKKKDQDQDLKTEKGPMTVK